MRRVSIVTAGLVAILATSPAEAAGVLVQSFASMATFQASPLYDYLVNQLPGGAAINCPSSIASVLQGDAAVPWSSAGCAANATVTPEVESALEFLPTVLGGSVDTSSYHKQYLSLGNETLGGGTPMVQVSIPSMVLPAVGGFQGYDVVIFDLGDELVPGSGNKNSERSTFRIESSAVAGSWLVGQITNTGGSYINAILLDVDGIPGAPSSIDRIDILDASGHNPPQKGSLDIDGAVRLTDDPVPALPSTWGRVKAFYH